MMSEEMGELYKRGLQSTEAMIWLLDANSKILLLSNGAEKLAEDYTIPLKKIHDILTGKGCSLHALQDVCQDCPIDGHLNPEAIPFQLNNKQGQLASFWGKLTTIPDPTTNTFYQYVEIRSWQTTQQVQQERLMLGYLNEAQEVERQRIARDLHDGLAQSMYSLMLESRRIMKKYQLEKTTDSQQLDVSFVELLQEIRTLAAELYPAALEDLGLLQAIFHLADQLKQLAGFKLNVEVQGMPFSIPKRTASHIYRIIQEAVTNSLKYAEVNQATVSFVFENNLCTIQVKDSGKGFDTSTQKHGLGLWNMQERAMAIGADISIHAAYQVGTTVTLRLVRMEETQ